MPRLLHFSLKLLGRRCSSWCWLLKMRKDLWRVAYFWLIYICIFLFWWNYIHVLFFFSYIVRWIPACLELIFLFKKKEFTLSVFSVCFFKESLDFRTSRNDNTVEKTPWELTGWLLLHFAVLLEIDGKNHAFPMW